MFSLAEMEPVAERLEDFVTQEEMEAAVDWLSSMLRIMWMLRRLDPEGRDAVLMKVREVEERVK